MTGQLAVTSDLFPRDIVCILYCSLHGKAIFWLVHPCKKNNNLFLCAGGFFSWLCRVYTNLISPDHTLMLALKEKQNNVCFSVLFFYVINVLIGDGRRSFHRSCGMNNFLLRIFTEAVGKITGKFKFVHFYGLGSVKFALYI